MRARLRGWFSLWQGVIADEEVTLPALDVSIAALTTSRGASKPIARGSWSEARSPCPCPSAPSCANSACVRVFQPRPSSERGATKAIDAANNETLFQPAPLERPRSDARCRPWASARVCFNPRPTSERGATARVPPSLRVTVVSTRALERTRSDRSRSASTSSDHPLFQPAPLERTRSDQKPISRARRDCQKFQPAPLERTRSDRVWTLWLSRVCRFNPRPSSERGATQAPPIGFVTPSFNPRPSSERGATWCWRFTACSSTFQPAPLERTRSDAWV